MWLLELYHKYVSSLLHLMNPNPKLFMMGAYYRLLWYKRECTGEHTTKTQSSFYEIYGLGMAVPICGHMLVAWCKLGT
jgi:hypothetical protein